MHPTASEAAAPPAVMGIVNVTPDSFSDGGRAAAPAAAIGLARRHLADGAAFVDIGAESTRPGAAEIPLEEEWRRLAPVLEVLLAEGAPVSVDTRKAEIMRRALALGAPMINDVSALTFDAAALDVIAGASCEVVLMHAKGLPEDMQENPTYDDVAAEVLSYLEARIAACAAAGIERRRIVADPGIGFGKTFRQNLELMAALPRFRELGVRLLVGASRKGFIGWLTGVKQADRRLGGSIGAALAAAAGGADILRVHDVAETVQALAVFHAARNGHPPPSDR
ncbi:dihydropteroate synthase [Minwuia thermotolerans]|uniref:Dihydropteroate synthase n=1 Tax=Minwuia thermotolerans TaxID=2056226 RepID=A0A2M9G795_9PROT|nr:dihydropteroate synthase [Minwuia thermotolerans]PJK31585.1 dihydropteroate synthase [Minwuia thermotolerans]